jgi:hypothetical protein
VTINRERFYAPNTLAATVLVAMFGYPGGVSASDEAPGASMFSFSGFGTLGAVHSNEDHADFTDVLKPNGAGYTHRWSTDVDSRIAGQVNARFTSQFSAMVQVISEQLYDNTYKPQVEWANLKYQPTPQMSFRAGRIVLPAFLISDSRKVGYAYPWVRPPGEIYTLAPVNNSDGVDANYRLPVGGGVHSLSASYGRTYIKLPGGDSADVRRLWIISDSAEYGAATVHLSFAQGRFTFSQNELDTLFNTLRQFGPQGNALADKYDVDDKLVQFIALGAMYDPGGWFVMGEWGRRELHSVFGKSTAWYVSGGYRVAQLTPYLTYAEVTANSNTSDPGLAVSALPAFLAGPATALNAGLNSALRTIAVQRTTSAGVRWDFAKNVDLKVQYDYILLGAGSPGVLSNLQPGFQPGGTVSLFSAVIDFVL